ncbi:molybdenum cofactor synthesis domain-containing protein [Paramicrobacterium agarici]|nr:molybdenum cofactor synthesis domain-containing protein [Microbacterium agarici]
MADVAYTGGMQNDSPSNVARVITVSDRAFAGQRNDVSGPLAVSMLEEAGWSADVKVVPDDIDAVAGSIRSAVDDGARLVVTTGGTGITERDVTPQATAPLLRLDLAGVAEQIRRVGAENVPTALLSRGLAGVSGNALVVNLAGSPGAVRDGIPVVVSVAGHVLSQLDGADHS